MSSNDVIGFLLFLLLSAGLVYISRSSLRLPLTHGFPRFVAWEAILALFFINAHSWFRDPFSISQIISWLFLVISLVLIMVGVWTLRLIGKPDASRDEDGLLGIEKTTTLVTTGIYRYIRHPFYSSLLFLTWGIFLKALSWPGIIIAIVASVCLELIATIEEREDIKFFGQAYQEYMKTTKKFIPLIH